MIFANIFSPLTPYSASGRIFLIRGICLIAYRMLLTPVSYTHLTLPTT